MSDFKKSYLKDISIFYLEKAINIESVFFRNVIYLSLASIIFSLFFLDYIFPIYESKSTQIQSVNLLFVSWLLYFLTIASTAFMVFFSALFKDIMFDGSIDYILNNKDRIQKCRQSPAALLVYLFAIASIFLFLMALGALLLFVKSNLDGLLI